MKMSQKMASRNLISPLRQKARLHVETLEERMVMNADWMISGAGLTVPDASQQPSSILVQFEGQSQAQEIAVAEGYTVEQAIAEYENDSNVVYAEANRTINLLRTPNDTFFNYDYAKHNTGNNAGRGANGQADADIDAVEAWDKTTGSTNVTVAVIDTGVDYTHQDIYKNIWINQGEISSSLKSNLTDIDGDNLITFYDLNDSRNSNYVSDLNGNGYIDGGDLLNDSRWENGIDEDGNSLRDDIIGWNFVNYNNDPMDYDGHGTHVAGTIGAMGNNNEGVAGVVWKTQIMAIRFLGNGGGTTTQAVNSINYSVIEGAEVSNNSWGSGYSSQAIETAVGNASNAGQIFVAAAGNDAQNNDVVGSYPADYNFPTVVSVAATDKYDRLASFSNYGRSTVHIAAPGVDIASLTPGGGYQYLSGTSMATPQVTGAFAALLSYNSTLTAQQAIQAVYQSGDALSSLTNYTVTGRRLNLNKALSLVGPGGGDTTPDPGTGAYVVSAVANASGNMPVSSVRVTFSEAIDSATFTAGDLTLTGPEGTLSITGVKRISDKVYDVSFAEQWSPGNYTITVGPNIKTTAKGNLMDQDKDGNFGEATQDRFVGNFTIDPRYTYTNSTRSNIRDRSWTKSTQNVSRSGKVVDLNVTLNISHTYTGDLQIYLQAPDKSYILLSNGRGGSSDNFNNTQFNDEVGTAIANGSAGFSGSYKPEQALSAFDGKEMNGEWTLWVYDRYSGDVGALNSWTLEFVADTSSGASSRAIAEAGAIETITQSGASEVSFAGEIGAVDSSLQRASITFSSETGSQVSVAQQTGMELEGDTAQNDTSMVQAFQQMSAALRLSAIDVSFDAEGDDNGGNEDAYEAFENELVLV